jgi:uncharacterized membrane protein
MDHNLLSKEKYLLGTCWKLANTIELPAIVVRSVFILAPFLLMGLLCGEDVSPLVYILWPAGVYLIITIFVKKKKIVDVSPLVPKREWKVHIFSSYPIIAMFAMIVGMILTTYENELFIAMLNFKNMQTSISILTMWLIILIIPCIALIGVAKRVLHSSIRPPERTVLIVAHLILFISFFLPWFKQSWGQRHESYPMFKTLVAPFFICLVVYSAVHSISNVRKFIGYRIVLPLMIVIAIAPLASIIKEHGWGVEITPVLTIVWIISGFICAYAVFNANRYTKTDADKITIQNNSSESKHYSLDALKDRLVKGEINLDEYNKIVNIIGVDKEIES